MPNSIFNAYFWVRQIFQRKKLKRVKKSGNYFIGLSRKEIDIWKRRINLIKVCPDNLEIKKPFKTTLVDYGLLRLYNGVIIDPLSYYDLPNLKLLLENDGIHEPQEEKVFHEVLRSIATHKDKPVMMELGAYWSFYSLSFKQVFENGKNYMIEPNRLNLQYGRKNFALNKQEGEFLHGAIGSSYNDKNNIYSIDSLADIFNLDYIDILHSDIQGYEYEMLLGAETLLKNDGIGYIFISTHSNDIHYKCRDYLMNNYAFDLVTDINLDESYCWDGILVLKSKSYKGISKVKVSKQNKLISSY